MNYKIVLALFLLELCRNNEMENRHMKYKKIMDVRSYNLRKHREWDFCQANYSEGRWLKEQFDFTESDNETVVYTPFKDWRGMTVKFKVDKDGKQGLFLHDDGYYLSQLEEHYADIFPEVKRQFLESHTIMLIESKYGFIMKSTGCYDQRSANFIFQIQQYCLALTHLVGLVVGIDQTFKLKTADMRES